MAHESQNGYPSGEVERLGRRTWPIYRSGVMVGAIGLAAALLIALILSWMGHDGWERFGFAYLVSYAFFLSIGLGCLFFVLITHLFRAGWSVVVRRVAEVFAASLPVLGILSAPVLVYVLINTGILYPWAQPVDAMEQAVDQARNEAARVALEVGAARQQELTTARGPGSEMQNPWEQAQFEREAAEAADVELAGVPVPGLNYVMGKRVWLNNTFFTVRWIFYVAVWCGLGYWYWRTSTRQDTEGTPGLTRKMEIFSAPALLLFGFTLTFASFDLIMSLDPLWYSTIFGVYYFAGSFLAALCVMILTIMGLQRVGLLQQVGPGHFHDLGKLLFAFVFFWGYIAFSQYMLLWYANIPETAYWFDVRGLTTVAGRLTPWTFVGLALLFGHLLIPFAALLPRWVKRSRKLLAFWAVWLLVFHWVDLWWVIMPMHSQETIPLPLIEIACLVGIGGLFVAGVARAAGEHPLIPLKDPRLGESLGHH